jgi:signal transduction histidine kinase
MQSQEEERDRQAAAGTMNAEVLATVGHELRSPLTSIKGYTATLLRQERRLSRQERQEFLLAIREASERLEAIIERFLEMSQLETGNLNARPIPVDAARLAQEALLNAQQRTNESLPGLFTFHLRLKDEHGALTSQEPLILADPRLLREVLDNLLDNAINYSPDGGRIDIVIYPVRSSSAARQYVEQEAVSREEQQEGQNSSQTEGEAEQMLDICVCDHGLGIPDEHLERIFERFHRVDTRLTRTVNGLGLGLTICKRIVEMHGGRIWAESCSAGGSAFHVLFPLARESEESDVHEI